MGFFDFFNHEIKNGYRQGLFQPKKWTRGNDIYGVRDRGMSHNDAEGKYDIYDKNAGVTRSGFYHSYWRGWSEVRVNRLGRPYTIERVYTAPWIRQDLSTRDYVLVRILYGLLIALAVALFSFAMTRRVGSNSCWYVALFGLPSTIIMTVNIWMYVSYAKAKRKMTLWEHRSTSSYLKYVSLVYSILLCLTSLSTVLYIILNPNDEPLRQLLNVGLDLLAAGCAFVVFWLERKMKYVDIPNPNKTPAGGFEIR